MNYCPNFSRMWKLWTRKQSAVAPAGEVVIPTALGHPSDKVLQSAASINDDDDVIPTIPTPIELPKPVLPTPASYENFIKYQTDNLVKSEEDKKSYRGIDLHNGMKIILINDPKADKAAVAMDVSVGSMCDPSDLPGLAHFCEHMLFMGTEKYPGENDYEKFLSDHGSAYNAFTGDDHTNYHFDIVPEFLAGALDRFAQFFLTPLFTATSTEREVNAVDSENNNNVQADGWRINQLKQSAFSSPGHDYAKFGTGNKKTLWDAPGQLGINVRDELLKFHQKYYSANLMSLCVIGKVSLDDLTAMVVPLFGDVPNRDAPRPEWPEHPCGPEQAGYRLDVVPIADTRSLTIMFAVPDLSSQYRAGPGDYLSHLIGHEGPGSVMCELRRRNWINGLGADISAEARGFGFCSINTDLTEDGMKHIDDIIELIFAYISLLKETGPQEWVFQECANLCRREFRFNVNEEPLSNAIGLSGCLHDLPWEDLLPGSKSLVDYRPDLIEHLLSFLTPKNLNIVVVSKEFEGKTDRKELWYGTDYRLEKISSDLLNRLENAKVDKTVLHLPTPNDLIPTNFQLYPLQNPEKDQKFPQLILNTETTRIWYKQDDEFLLPHCCICIYFRNPPLYIDRMNLAAAGFYCGLVNDSLTEFSYNAKLAGMDFGFSASSQGIWLTITGYNDKQAEFLKELLEKIRDFQLDVKKFEIAREETLRGLKSFETEQPSGHAGYYMDLVLSHQSVPIEESIWRAENITADQVTGFGNRFLSKLFIECFVHGNTTKAITEHVVNVTQEVLGNPQPMKISTNINCWNREVSLPEGCYYLYQNVNTVHPNSAIIVYYQVGTKTLRHLMLLELLEQICQEPCFDQLRTKEQLGYDVGCGSRYSNGTLGFCFSVQGDRPPDYVETRVELFLAKMQKTISEITVEAFNDVKNTLTAKILQKPKQLTDLAFHYWGEIAAENYNFDFPNLFAEEIKKIAKDEIAEFYNDYLSITAKKRKKLCIYVYSTQALEYAKTSESMEAYQKSVTELKETIGSDYVAPQPTKIDDIPEFKSRLPLHGLPEPLMKLKKGSLELEK